MSARPLVSVITPSLNQGEYILDCLESVERQGYAAIEHIVVDGGSTDSTVALLERRRSKRLRWISEPDRGQAHAINKGLGLAQGEVVSWLNSDDLYFHHGVIERVMDEFARVPSADAIVGDGYQCDRHKRLLCPIILEGNSLSARKMRLADLILQPSAFWRRNDLRLDESYDYVFDWLFFLEMFERSMNVVYLREFLSLYRWHGENKTALDTSARRKEIARVLRRTVGPLDPTTLWCGLVYLLYRLAEATGLRSLHAATRKANAVVSALTRYRIGSG